MQVKTLKNTFPWRFIKYCESYATGDLQCTIDILKMKVFVVVVFQ